MKFRVLFLRKKYLFYFLLILLVFIFFIVFSVLKYNSSSHPTFNINVNAKAYKMDLTGDGEDDIFYIELENNKYSIKIKSKYNTYYLKPINAIKTMGIYSLYWPLKVKFIDINRDKIPEIFIQSSKKNESIQHIFIYSNGEFYNIFSSLNNTLGFIDHSNNKTTKFISGNIKQGQFIFSNYIVIQNKLEKYNRTSQDTFMGKNTILSFINFVTTINSNPKLPKSSILSPTISPSSQALINALFNSKKSYIFQDANFRDIESDTKGEPNKVQWILNFRGISNTTNPLTKNYRLKLILNKFSNTKDNYSFKINSITEIN